MEQGSYATVYEWEEIEVKKCCCEDSDSVCHFRDECHICSQLEHPNVMQFLGFYFNNGE